jgi:alpha-L-rhamnosidase
MAERGTQTCWETFEFNETTWTRSVAHAWSAAPAVYLPAQVLGIRPIKAGFRKFTIQPLMNDLQWARGSVATPYGPIYLNLRRNEKGEVEISCSAPAACERVIPGQD